ncbi:aspartate-semialdehyde dehydrogenase [Halalkalibaculum sp. DA3122]|uniref:aspartate-semialdehyde dehydrogenase n=1 Tax=Halalkalibaculum sp. DA3122 TaxID=3373607 RepID=UPI00375463BF
MHSFNVGILGATGAVGQKFIRLLRRHPWFTIKALGASKRSAGKTYKQAAHWIEDIELPGQVAKLKVSTCEPAHFEGVDFVFSGLDSSVAKDIEQAFATAGIPVISNAKNHRMFDSVPLLVPEVNPDHVEMIKSQDFTADGSGWIVTNPNCVCVPLSMSLRPIFDAFGIESVVVTSMQAVSGAGYPGVPSLDILGNAVPFIGGEEDKIHTEPLKLLGTLNSNGTVTHADFGVQSTAVRIPTVEGHLLSVAVKLKEKPSDISDVQKAIEDWKSPIADLDLPSAPKQPVKLYEEERHPQPRLHSARENGMQLGMGRLRTGSVFDISYIALAHNTVRGAAGGAILNAELLAEKGYLN